MEPLTLLDAALRGALVGLLLLLAAQLLRDRPAAWAARLGAAMAVGLCLQAVSSAPVFEAGVPWCWQVPLVAVSVGNGVLFWGFALALFHDGWVLRPRHVAVWLAVLAVAAWQCIRPTTAGGMLMRWLPLLFAVLALASAASRWQADLVERRRRLRAFIVVGGSVYTAVMVGARLLSPHGRLTAPAAGLDVAMLLFIAAVMAWQLLRSVDTDLFPLARAAAGASVCAPACATAGAPAMPAAAPVPAPPDLADERVAQALQRAMDEDEAWRDEDLSVAGLADRLGVPAYRLRRVINGRLGHRNFNAYVNRFRLDQAQRALADPARREQAVLSVALDAGFGSIGPFNRAFKADTGLTPTEFRRRRLADS